jgi:hypothetical protein
MQLLAGEVLHRDVRATVVGHSAVVDSDDAGMIEDRERASFGDHAVRGSVGDEVLVEHLDRERSA